MLAWMPMVGVALVAASPPPLLMCEIPAPGESCIEPLDWPSILEWFEANQSWQFGDLNFDGLTDQQDVYWFGVCAEGPDVPAISDVLIDGHYYDVHCGFADLDRDGDVDLVDFAILQRTIGRRP